MNLHPAGIAHPTIMQPQLFSIGHSTHPLDVFLGLLARHDIEALADVRRFPGSRKHPHFNRDHLASALPQAGVEYRWFEALGGRRKGVGGSTANLGLRNESFRNYADYTASEAFRSGLAELRRDALAHVCAVMCSEAVWWRCHRRFIADYLLSEGEHVFHIMGLGKIEPARLNPAAVGQPDGTLLYLAQPQPDPDGA